MLFWRRGSGHFCRRSLPRHIASLKGGSTPTKSQVAENPPKMREGMRGGGFEPPRLAAIGPQPIVSASFTIPASHLLKSWGVLPRRGKRGFPLLAVVRRCQITAHSLGSPFLNGILGVA